MQDFDGDFTVMLEVLREIHRGHAAASKLALDAVAVGQGSGETIWRLGQGRRLSDETPLSIPGKPWQLAEDRTAPVRFLGRFRAKGIAKDAKGQRE